MKYLLIALLFTATSVLTGQSKALLILDTVVVKAQEISLYSETVDWDILKTDIYRAAAGAENIKDLKPALEILLNGLRDHHGMVRSLTDYSIIAHFTDQAHSRKKDTRIFDAETWKIVNAPDSRFEFALLPDNIGYLKVVGIGPNVDGQIEAERIRGAIRALNSKKVDGWVIDLRYNGGGNINVMLAGLAPLLDAREVLSIQDDKGEVQATAEIIKGNFWYYGASAFSMPKGPRIRNPKIAILTSRWTASSGEFVAVAFKGQTRTRFFGEATGGYTTNNCWETIDNQIALVISTGIYCDRNGNAYPEHVAPDVEIQFVVETHKVKDQGIIEAVRWLKD